MSFLEGFAKEGMRQLDVYREDKKQQDKLKEQRAYNEGRYSIERADRKQDTIDSKNQEISLEDRSDMKRIYKTPEGGFMTTVRSIGPDGQIKITPEQVTDKALITQWESWTEENRVNAEAKKLSLQNAGLEGQLKALELRHAPEKHRSAMATDAAQRASYSQRGTKDKEINVPGYLWTMIQDGAAGKRNVMLQPGGKDVLNTAVTDARKAYGSEVVPNTKMSFMQIARAAEAKERWALEVMSALDPYLVYKDPKDSKEN